MENRNINRGILSNKAEAARNVEFSGSIVVSLASIENNNHVELAEVHKLFALAGFFPEKSVKALSAEELGKKFVPFAKVEVRGRELVVTVESNGKSFVYVGLPSEFYSKFFKYDKVSAQHKGYNHKNNKI
jgi:hypothetical protein